MNTKLPFRPHEIFRIMLIGVLAATCGSSIYAQNQQREDEIVASMAGGRVIVHVTKDNIVFAAIDQPVEAKSIPPRVMDLDPGHVAILLGASEWRVPAEPKPVRLDKDFQRVTAKDPKYQIYSGEAEPDLESIGVAFLEKLRPLVSQLRQKIDFKPDEPIFEVVIIGFAPNEYGPEVWTMEYRVQQEAIAARGDYWQTRVLRPRFEQLYPPEKHAPRTIVETRFPPKKKGPELQDLIQENDPAVARLRSADLRFAKLMDLVSKGQAQKAVGADAADFMRAVVPLLAPNARFVIGKIEAARGFEWVVEPDDPVEKTKDDKDRPPDAPTLRRRPN